MKFPSELIMAALVEFKAKELLDPAAGSYIECSEVPKSIRSLPSMLGPLPAIQQPPCFGISDIRPTAHGRILSGFFKVIAISCYLFPGSLKSLLSSVQFFLALP